MRCPTLSELPLPPSGRNGWPWTEESPKSPDTMPDGAPWPRVSIVTPSYNQGRFIEETIRSVLLQGYPDLEYIIIDGGSSDNSLEIIKKYVPWLTYWVSEPDRGQSHGINKGFEKATGEVFGWLNSDDYFHPGGLGTLMTFRQSHLDAVAWVGACMKVDINGTLPKRRVPRVGNKEQIGDWWHKVRFFQPSCLFSAEKFRAAGGLDEKLEILLDADLWMRLADFGSFAPINEVISSARIYPGIKSGSDPLLFEVEKIAVNWKNGLPGIAKRTLLRYARLWVAMYLYRTAKRILRYFRRGTRL